MTLVGLVWKIVWDMGYSGVLPLINPCLLKKPMNSTRRLHSFQELWGARFFNNNNNSNIVHSVIEMNGRYGWHYCNEWPKLMALLKWIIKMLTRVWNDRDIYIGARSRRPATSNPCKNSKSYRILKQNIFQLTTSFSYLGLEPVLYTNAYIQQQSKKSSQWWGSGWKLQ